MMMSGRMRMKKGMKNPQKMGTKLGGGMLNQKGKKKTSGWKNPKKK
jgi:hypothetical protein